MCVCVHVCVHVCVCVCLIECVLMEESNFHYIRTCIHCIRTYLLQLQTYIRSIIGSCCVEVVLAQHVHQLCIRCNSHLFCLACFSYILQFTFLLLGTSHKEQVTAEPKSQQEKKRPQPDGSYTKCDWTRLGFMFVLVFFGLYLAYCSNWLPSSLAPGQSPSNQGEGM